MLDETFHTTSKACTEQPSLVTLYPQIKTYWKKREIAIIKSDKSGKLTAILKEDYLKMGNKSNAEDRKVSRKERKEIEK